MGRVFLEYLTAKKFYACRKCEAHFVDQKDLVSKVSDAMLSLKINLLLVHL